MFNILNMLKMKLFVTKIDDCSFTNGFGSISKILFLWRKIMTNTKCFRLNQGIFFVFTLKFRFVNEIDD